MTKVIEGPSPRPKRKVDVEVKPTHRKEHND